MLTKYYQEISRSLDILNKCILRCDDYWITHRVPFFNKMINYIVNDTHKRRYENFLNNVQTTIFSHGDFSEGNIGICNNNLVFYDFQHSALSPKLWDIAYLLSYTDPNKRQYTFLTPQICFLAEFVAAMRIARYKYNGNYMNYSYYNCIYEKWIQFNKYNNFE